MLENERIASASRRLGERIRSLLSQIESLEKQIASLESSNMRQTELDERRRRLLEGQLESLLNQKRRLEAQSMRLALLEKELSESDSSLTDLKEVLRKIQRNRWIERGVWGLIVIGLVIVATS